MPILPFFPFFVGTCSPDLLAGKKVPIREMRTASQLLDVPEIHYTLSRGPLPADLPFLYFFSLRSRQQTHHVLRKCRLSILLCPGMYNESNEITSRSTQAHQSRIFGNRPHNALTRKWQAANIMPLALETSRLYPSSKGTEPYHVLRIRYLDGSDSHQRRR